MYYLIALLRIHVNNSLSFAILLQKNMLYGHIFSDHIVRFLEGRPSACITIKGYANMHFPLSLLCICSKALLIDVLCFHSHSNTFTLSAYQ